MAVLDQFRRDIVWGVRFLARTPGLSASAIVTLAVAIGANTAIFTVVNALLFAPVPVVEPDTLARLDTGVSLTSWPNYADIRERNTVFSDVVAYRRLSTGLGASDVSTRLTGEMTSSNFFNVLGVSAALGRTFSTGESRHDLVVLADHTWRVRFGADSRIVGRSLTLGGQHYEVAGVMPPKFRGLAPPGLRPDFWLPVDTVTPNRALADRNLPQFDVVGRLKPSIGHDQATAALQVLARQIREQHPDLPESFLTTEAGSADGIGAFKGMASLVVPIFAFLALMTIVSGFVLLIGCANIAGLLMGRAATRQREIAVRLALGSSRSRIVRQLLTESFVLALAGGAAGVLLTLWLVGGVNLLAARLPVAVEFDLQIDRRVLGYAFGLTTLTSLLFGLAPARSATRFNLVSSLQDGSGGSTARQRLRRLIVVGQVGVCTALLVWSGLFLRSLSRIGAVDPGFDASGVLLATAELPRGPDEDERADQVFVTLTERLATLPGVQSVSLATVVPLALMGREEFNVGIEGDPAGARRRVVANRLAPGWFETVRIPLVAGRDFTWNDRVGAPTVAIVNQTLARQFWQGDALGKRLSYGSRSLEVIAVARDSKYLTLGETTRPMVYLPFRQHPMFLSTLHVRTSDMKGATAVINREMAQLAPNVPVEIETMADAVAVAVVPAQVGAAATGVFGAVAMFLSALGIYGLVSFSVVQRRREIGVRTALGATAMDVIRLIVGGSTKMAGVGVVIGLGIGVLGAMAIGGFLTGVSPVDPITLALTTTLVLSVAIVASAVPAVRAARVNPLVALRDR